MNLPYLPLFVDDYEADTAHLSLVEDGIYSRLLRLCWRSPRCRMPNDHEWIARKIRVASEAERTAMVAVLKEFFSIRRGAIFSKRLSAEFERVSVSVQRRKNAGKSGGEAKALKTKELEPSNARALPKHPEPEPEPIEKPTGFSQRASARKTPRGWISPRTATDAANALNEEIDRNEQRRIEIGIESPSGVVLQLPAVRSG